MNTTLKQPSFNVLVIFAMRIPEQYLDRLREAGLVLSEPFPSNHVAFADGVMIAKPTTVPGNSIPHFETQWNWETKDEILIDTPSVYFHGNLGKWVVTGANWFPGPGPGDFVHAYPTPAEGVYDILDFFFGDPGRMTATRRP